MRALILQIGKPGFLAASLVFLFCMVIFSAQNARAQNVQTAECSGGCDFAADIAPAPSPAAASCILVGWGGAPLSKPVVAGTATTIPAPKPALTCWWPKVVVAPGSYSVTAIAVDAAGKQSQASLPLSLTVSAVPLGAPGAPRIVPAP